MRDLALHTQVLLLLKRRVATRQKQHEARCGEGLEDREYQRHVGRIKEAKAILEDIETLIKTGVDELEEFDEDRERERDSRGRRTAR